MGNFQRPPPPKVEIILDKPKFSIYEPITGRLNFPENNAHEYNVEIIIEGFEEGEYGDTQPSFKYQVKRNKFYSQSRLYTGINFSFSKITQPSMCIDLPQRNLSCKIYYQIKAIITRGWFKYNSEPSNVIVYKPYRMNNQENQLEQHAKRNFTIKCHKDGNPASMTIETEFKKNTFFPNDTISLSYKIDNAGNLGISSIKAFLCAEFYMKHNKVITGMPKVYLSAPRNCGRDLIGHLEFQINQEFQSPKATQRVSINTIQTRNQSTLPFTQNSSNIEIPPITLGEKIGCMHLVILQIEFEKPKWYQFNKSRSPLDCDIMFPLEIYPNCIDEQQEIDFNQQMIDAEQQNQQPRKKQKQWSDVYPMFALNHYQNKNMRIALKTQFIQSTV